MADFQVPVDLEAAYDGTLNATVIEFNDPLNPDTGTPTNTIRTTQRWALDVRWEMHGVQASYLVDEFRVQVYLESIGPGTEYSLPLAGPVVVGTMSGVLGALAGKPQRTYFTRIETPAGTVNPGVYKLVTLIQLHDDAGPGTPYPIIGTVEEGTLVTFFKPN